MNCKRCQRPLTQHHESGMGAICQMKANQPESESAKPVTITLVYDSKTGRRNYEVRGAGKAFVSVNAAGEHKIIRCFCAANKAHGTCEHIALVEDADNQRFPQAATPAVEAPVSVPVNNPATVTAIDEPVHRTSDGRRIPISQLEDSHLLAILPSVRFSLRRVLYINEANRRGLSIGQPSVTLAA